MIPNSSLGVFSAQPGPAPVQQRTAASLSLPSGSAASVGTASRIFQPPSRPPEAVPGRRGSLLDIQA